MDLSADQIRWIFTYVFLLIASVAFHEFGHAFVADKLGDDTPSRQGRVTLNPLAHADPIGTFMLPLMSAVFGAAAGGGGGGFGWGKPVQTNPLRYTRRFSMATGQVFVALAGPGMNLLLALVFAVVHVVLVRQQLISSDVSKIFLTAVSLNFTLMFFNLLPVPPLDGGWVVQRFIPRQHARSFETFSTYGPFVLLAVVAIPALGRVIMIPAMFCQEHLYRGLAAILL